MITTKTIIFFAIDTDSVATEAHNALEKNVGNVNTFIKITIIFKLRLNVKIKEKIMIILTKH